MTLLVKAKPDNSDAGIIKQPLHFLA